jgi:hypothetical protein
MTPEERRQVEKEEAARIEAENAKLSERIEKLKALAIAGKSQKELETIANKYGIKLSPTFAEDTRRTEAERLEGERLREEELKAIEESNKRAREEAEQRRIAEEQKQAEELKRQQAYIDASAGLPTSEDDIDPVRPVETRNIDTTAYDRGPAVVDQTDSTRVQTDIGETPYSGSASRKNQLEAMKRILLENPINGDDLITDMDTNVLGKRMG